MELKKLSEKMDYKERVGPGGKMLKYITARQAQDRLDEVCGPQNWKVEYKEISGNIFAGVSIKVSDEWITKWDAGSESNIEKEKGHISDSFKRACVCWGIGRFLYGELPEELPTIAKANIDSLTKLIKEGKTISMSDVTKKYKLTPEAKIKLEALGIK